MNHTLKSGERYREKREKSEPKETQEGASGRESDLTERTCETLVHPRRVEVVEVTEDKDKGRRTGTGVLWKDTSLGDTETEVSGG